MGGRDVVADLKYIKRIQGTDIPGALVITSALQHYYTPTGHYYTPTGVCLVRSPTIFQTPRIIISGRSRVCVGGVGWVVGGVK